MGKVIYPRKGEVHTAPVTFAANFADNTWEQIIKACESGIVPDTWVVGDQKSMTINGTDYLIDIIGKNHDTYADGSGTAPLTFQLHDCYAENKTMHSSNTTSGGWANCLMRNTHLPSILALMPSEVQTGIKEVNKRTSLTGTTNITADKLFLLSEVELFGAVTFSGSGEGKQYAYYAAGNSKLKSTNGSVSYWWERSPSIVNVVRFCAVTTSGDANHYNPAGNTIGVSFAFCF